MPVYDTKVEAPFYTGASTQFFLINLFQYVKILSRQPEQIFLAFCFAYGIQTPKTNRRRVTPLLCLLEKV